MNDTQRKISRKAHIAFIKSRRGNKDLESIEKTISELKVEIDELKNKRGLCPQSLTI